jgi:transmembrane sensor
MTPNEHATANDETRRLEQAADWAALLREDASEADIVRWMEWCEADPRNQDAFDRVQSFWRVAGGLAGEVENGELTSASRTESIGDRRPAPPAAPRRRRMPRFAVAASALLATVAVGALGWNLYQRLYWPEVGGEAVVAAAADPVRNARLPDGSRVQLATRSVVEVNYTEDRRFLALRDGEAYFSVAHSPERPFVVHVDDVRVRAVGTAFNIRRAGQRSVVTVTEGTVEVYRERDGNEVRAVAGERVTWEETGHMQSVPEKDSTAGGDLRVAAVDVSEVLAWREGRLEYTDEPLYAVIADFNRYSEHPVEIHGDAVRRLRFSGTLLTDVTEEWLYALPHLFPVDVRRQGEAYVIEPRNSQAG